MANFFGELANALRRRLRPNLPDGRACQARSMGADFSPTGLFEWTRENSTRTNFRERRPFPRQHARQCGTNADHITVPELVSNFLVKHADGILYATLSAVLAWFALNLVGNPVLVLRELRLKALRVAERYAYFGPTSTQSEERVREVRRELFDIGSELRAQARGQSLAVRCYRLFRCDLEGAAAALGGLADMAGEDYPDQVRTNNLNYVYISLHAHRHLSPETLRKHKEMVNADGRRESKK
jgi:hypothetical protein